MTKSFSLQELYAKRDRNNSYLAKLAQRQRALGDKIKADEKLLDSYTRRERTHRLCTRAGMLESFLRDPEALSNGQVFPVKDCFSTKTRQRSIEKNVTRSLFG